MQSEPKIMKSSKLPIQAVPVERTVTGVRMSNQNGVDPSLNWRRVWQNIKPFIKAGASLV